MRKSLSDLFAGLGFLFIAMLFWVQYDGLSGVSRVFPEALITFITLGGVYFVLKGFWRMSRERKQAARAVAADSDGQDGAGEDHMNWMRVGQISVLAVVFLFLVHPLGFFSSSAIFLFVAALLLGDKNRPLPARLLTSALYALLFNLCVWLLFAKLLYVPTPEGLLF